MKGDRDWRFGRALGLLVLLGAVVRVVYALSQQEHMPLMGDAYVYTVGAEALANGHGWIDPYGSFERLPTASHPPLYMVWLWIPAFFADNHQVSQLTNMLWSSVIGTASVALCGLAGREIAGRRCGLIAAGLAAVYPGLWVHDGQLLSETMAVFTASGVLLFAYRYWNRPSLARALWLGVWCGLATLARSELVLTFPLVLAPLVLLTRSCDWPRRLGRLAVAGAIGVLVVSPWLIYNADRFNRPVILSTSSGRTMAAANCDETYSGSRLGFKRYACLDRAASRYDSPRFDESDRDHFLRAEARQFIEDNLLSVPKVVAARWGRITQLYQQRQEIQLNGYYQVQGRVATELQFWSFYVVLGLAVVGAVTLARRRVMILPLLALPAITLIAVALTFAQWRYRAPSEPALVLLAAGAIDAGWQRFRAKRDPAGSVSRT